MGHAIALYRSVPEGLGVDPFAGLLGHEYTAAVRGMIARTIVRIGEEDRNRLPCLPVLCTRLSGFRRCEEVEVFAVQRRLDSP